MSEMNPEELPPPINVEPYLLPPSMQEPLEVTSDPGFINDLSLAGPGVSDDILNTMVKTDHKDNSTGELVEIGQGMDAAVDVLLQCKRDGRWPDWLKWWKREMPRNPKLAPAKLAAIIDRAGWHQTAFQVAEEIHCRMRGVLVIQSNVAMVRVMDSGLELTLGE